MKTDIEKRSRRNKKGQQKNADTCLFVSEYARLSCRQRKKRRSKIHAEYMRLGSITSPVFHISDRQKLKLNCDHRKDSDKSIDKLKSLDRVQYLQTDARQTATLSNGINTCWRETTFDRYQKPSAIHSNNNDIRLTLAERASAERISYPISNSSLGKIGSGDNFII